MHFTCYMSPIFCDTPLFFPVSGLNTALYGKVQFLQRGTPEVVGALLDAAGVSQPDIVTVGGLGFFDLFADENAQMVRQLIDAGYEFYRSPSLKVRSIIRSSNSLRASAMLARLM